MYPISPFRKYVFFILSVCLSMIGITVEAIAEKEAVSASGYEKLRELPSEKSGNHANELIKQINDYISVSNRYSAAMKDASQEDRLALELQMVWCQDRAFDALQELAETLLLLEKRAPEPALRNQVEDIYRQVAPNFWETIKRLRDMINTARTHRLEADIKKRYDIESEVSKYSERVDELFKKNFRHIENMAKLGMDNRTYQKELVRQLSERAEELSGRIALALNRIDRVDERISKKIPKDTEATTLRIVLLKSLNTNTTSMRATLQLMEQLGLDPDLYKAQLAGATRDIGTNLFDPGVAAKLVGRAFGAIAKWFTNTGPSLLLKLVIFFGILFAFRIATRIVRLSLENVLQASKLNLSELMRLTIVSWASKLVMLIGILVALSQLGIRLGPMLAGLGIAGFIVGFALQDTLSNFASGGDDSDLPAIRHG